MTNKTNEDRQTAKQSDGHFEKILAISIKCIKISPDEGKKYSKNAQNSFIQT